MSRFIFFNMSQRDFANYILIVRKENLHKRNHYMVLTFSLLFPFHFSVGEMKLVLVWEVTFNIFFLNQLILEFSCWYLKDEWFHCTMRKTYHKKYLKGFVFPYRMLRWFDLYTGLHLISWNQLGYIQMVHWIHFSGNKTNELCSDQFVIVKCIAGNALLNFNYNKAW